MPPNEVAGSTLSAGGGHLHAEGRVHRRRSGALAASSTCNGTAAARLTSPCGGAAGGQHGGHRGDLSYDSRDECGKGVMPACVTAQVRAVSDRSGGGADGSGAGGAGRGCRPHGRLAGRSPGLHGTLLNLHERLERHERARGERLDKRARASNVARLSHALTSRTTSAQLAEQTARTQLLTTRLPRHAARPLRAASGGARMHLLSLVRGSHAGKFVRYAAIY